MALNLRRTGLVALMLCTSAAVQARCIYEGTRYAPMLCPVAAAQGAQASQGGSAPAKREAYPGSVALAEGRYFIVNAGSGDALQGVATSGAGPTAVALTAFDRSSAQQWVLKRVQDSQTQKLTNRVTLELAGPKTMYLQPSPKGPHAAALGPQRTASYSLHPAAAGGYLIRSFQRNGDALHAVPNRPEARFGPSTDAAPFVWQLVPAQ